MAQPDLYKVLGVGKKDSAADIKKAYRKLARENHPDQNPGDDAAEERFKQVSAAYDILGDPEKRKQYDSGGIFSGGGNGPGGVPFDASSFGDIFSSFFGGNEQRGRAGRPRGARGRDLETEVRLSFDQSLAGIQVPVILSIPGPCDSCHGTGAAAGTSPKVCSSCQGRGIDSQGQGLFSISQPCARCQGSGTIIEEPCRSCGGSGQVEKTKRLKVNIPAGVKEGSRVRIAGRGEPGRNGGPDGDLYVITRVAPSAIFRRKGDNVEVEVLLTVPEQLLGAELEVPTLDGRKTLRVPAGTRSGSVQRLRGEGPPRLGAGKKTTRGDIHYRFVVDVPKTLTEEQSELVTKLSVTMKGENPRAKLFGTGGGS